MEIKRIRVVRFVAIAAVACVAAVPLQAFDLSDVQVHGFVTQSFVKTTDNQVFTLDSTGGDWAFSEVGINFTAEPHEDLRIGIQLFARDLGEQGNFEVEVDWAVGDYRWRDYLGFRLGKIKMPFGLYNEIRDADMARPSILLPQGIYSENLRDLINAYIGGEIYGTLNFGGSDLQYRVFGGTMDLDDAYVIERFMQGGAAAGLRGLPIQLDQPSYTIDNIQASMDYIYGLMLQWNTPLEGLRIRGTYHASESHFSNTTTYSGWMGQIPASITIGTETEYTSDHSCVLSAEFKKDRWLLAGEYWVNQINMKNQLTLLPFPAPPMPERVEDNTAWYLQAGYQFTDWFQLSSYYLDFSSENVSGGSPSAEKDHGDWHKDLAITSRFDISRNFLLKLEGHLIDGTAIVSGLDNPNGTVQDWKMFLARFTFYF